MQITVQIDITKPYRENRAAADAAFEKGFVAELLASTNGNISAAARSVQMDRKHLHDLAKKHDLR